MSFTLLGIGADNGAEFINAQMLRYSQQEKITFTRGRVGHKKDNPFIEQKNWSVVRRLEGYGRFDTPQQIKLLNKLYDKYRLFANFFLLVTKLIYKERVGSRVKKSMTNPVLLFNVFWLRLMSLKPIKLVCAIPMLILMLLLLKMKLMF